MIRGRRRRSKGLIKGTEAQAKKNTTIVRNGTGEKTTAKENE